MKNIKHGSSSGPLGGPLRGFLGASWGHLRGPLGASWAPLGAIWDEINQRMGGRGGRGWLISIAPWELLTSLCGPLLERSWSALGRSWGRLGALLGLSWGSLGPSWSHLEASDGHQKRKGENAKIINFL